jgi:hypothetical protein
MYTTKQEKYKKNNVKYNMMLKKKNITFIYFFFANDYYTLSSLGDRVTCWVKTPVIDINF